MDRAAKAAEIWDALERELIAAGIADPGKFLKPRAGMIRAIGNALRGPRGPRVRVAQITEEPVRFDHLQTQTPAATMYRQKREQLISTIDRRLNDLIDASIAGYQEGDSVEYSDGKVSKEAR